jgi:hypothetical protein
MQQSLVTFILGDGLSDRIDSDNKSCGFWCNTIWFVETWSFHFIGKLGIPSLEEFGVSSRMKLGVSRRYCCIIGRSPGGNLDIVDFVDVVENDSDLRWGSVISEISSATLHENGYRNTTMPNIY